MNKVEHLIMCVAEEAGEVAQIAGKCGRFGLRDSHEKTGNVPNYLLLKQEFNELKASIELLFASAGIDWAIIDSSAGEAKKRRIRHYMEYARERGVLREEPHNGKD